MMPLGVVQSDSAPSGFLVPITASGFHFNLRTLFDAAYPSTTPVSGDVINFTGTGTDMGTSVKAGGGGGSSSKSLIRGTWPSGVILKVNQLIILGGGGNARSAEADGGDAVDCTSGPVEFNNCYIAGGGGAGRSVYYGDGFGNYWSDGGGGAGYLPGFGDTTGGSAATNTTGGITFGGGGNGGNLGQPGSGAGFGPVSSSSPSGAAGRAIVGYSNATLNSCTVIGPTV